MKKLIFSGLRRFGSKSPKAGLASAGRRTVGSLESLSGASWGSNVFPIRKMGMCQKIDHIESID